MRRLYVRLRKDGYVRVRLHVTPQRSFGCRGSFEPEGSHSDVPSALRLDSETAWGGCRT
jgi:hypothetical protein